MQPIDLTKETINVVPSTFSKLSDVSKIMKSDVEEHVEYKSMSWKSFLGGLICFE
jgi:hypothetical protein